MRNIKQIKKLLLSIIAVTVLLSACDGFPSQATPTPEESIVEAVTPLVTATGEVVPAQWSRPSMSIAGIVEEVLVEEGDQVNVGEILVQLRGTEELQAAIATAEFEVTSAQKELDDLYENAETAKIEALEAISVAARQLRDEQYQLDNFTVPQEQADLETMEALDLMKERLDAARTAFEPYKYYSSNNPTREDLKEDLDEAQSDYNVAVKRLEYENAVEVAKANLEKARDDHELWKEGPDPDDVTVAEARLTNAEAARGAAQAALKDLELRAPFDGTVSELNIRPGEWVNPGEPVLLLADLENLRIETTDLNEIDAARVNVTNPTIVTFDALPSVVIGGVVKSIAPKAAEGSGVNYTAVIEMEEWPETLRWGMTAFVDIEVEE